MLGFWFLGFWISEAGESPERGQSPLSGRAGKTCQALLEVPGT